MSDKIPDDVVEAVNAVLPQLFQQEGSRPIARNAIATLIRARPDLARIICEPGKWAVVPVELTDAMTDAMFEAHDQWVDLTDVGAYGDMWAAAIAAARQEERKDG